MGIGISKITSLCSRLRYAIAPPSHSSIAHLIVRVEQGELRGKESVAKYSRKKYCSFLGVPFAQPPIDDLRFRPPQPCQPWDGIYDASRERWDCPQYDPMMFIYIGDEDCLYMNIYTPKPPQQIEEPLAVMVFVHGGYFSFGSGSRKLYGADFLINHDIIYIAINYRLGAFGFLNLGIKECPGNVGIKDCVCALQWIKRNIRNFGGDPKKVTLFGESAGAIIVHTLAISPLAQGLFSQIILQSGYASTNWAKMSEDPIEVAFKIGKNAGYDGTDSRKLIQHLKTLSQSELVRVTKHTLDKMMEENPSRSSHLTPTVETIAEGAVIPCSVEELIQRATPIPVLCGMNELEGAINLFALNNVIESVGKDFVRGVKGYFKINPDILPGVVQRVKKLYMGDKEVNRSTVRGIVEFFTDVIYYHFYDSLQPQLETKTPCYIYNFCYLSRLNMAHLICSVHSPIMRLLSDLKASYHGDELFFLFYVKLALIYPPLSTSNKNMIKLMTTMWTNFAKTGNPSTEEVRWDAATSENPCYLHIGDKTEMKPGKINYPRLSVLHEILDPVAIPF